jgi:ubiquitin-conjugating enzyme E2 I
MPMGDAEADAWAVVAAAREAKLAADADWSRAAQREQRAYREKCLAGERRNDASRMMQDALQNISSLQQSRPPLIDVLGADLSALVLQHAVLEGSLKDADNFRSTCQLMRAVASPASLRHTMVNMHTSCLHTLRLRMQLQPDDDVPALRDSLTAADSFLDGESHLNDEDEDHLRARTDISDPFLRRHRDVMLLRGYVDRANSKFHGHERRALRLITQLQELLGARATALAVLAEEQRRLEAHPLPGFAFTRADEGLEAWNQRESGNQPARIAVSLWSCTIPGLEGTIWTGARCPLRVCFYDDYPLREPSLYFPSGFWHPNCYPSGKLCLAKWTVQKRMADKQYLPKGVVKDPYMWHVSECLPVLLRLIQHSLDEPNNSDPCSEAPWRACKNDISLYNRRIRQMIESNRYDSSSQSHVSVSDDGGVVGDLGANPF